MNTDKPDVADKIFRAKMMHEIYESLATKFGYETRDETKDFDPTTPNGQLMIATVNVFTESEIGRLTAENDRLKKEVEAAKLMIRNIAFYAEDHTEPGGHCALCVIQGVVDGGIALLPLEGDSK